MSNDVKMWKMRAEKAEAEVAKLRVDLAAALASKYVEPMADLVPVLNPKTGAPMNGQFEYRKKEDK